MSKVVCVSNWGGYLLDYLYAFFTRGYHCDLSLMCNNEEFKVHRCIVSASSEYFRKVTKDVEILILPNEISIRALKEILKFMYTGKLEVTKENREELLYATELMKLPVYSRLLADEEGDVQMPHPDVNIEDYNVTPRRKRQLRRTTTHYIIEEPREKYAALAPTKGWYLRKMNEVTKPLRFQMEESRRTKFYYASFDDVSYETEPLTSEIQWYTDPPAPLDDSVPSTESGQENQEMTVLDSSKIETAPFIFRSMAAAGEYENSMEWENVIEESVDSNVPNVGFANFDSIISVTDATGVEKNIENVPSNIKVLHVARVPQQVRENLKSIEDIQIEEPAHSPTDAAGVSNSLPIDRTETEITEKQEIISENQGDESANLESTQESSNVGEQILRKYMTEKLKPLSSEVTSQGSTIAERIDGDTGEMETENDTQKEMEKENITVTVYKSEVLENKESGGAGSSKIVNGYAELTTEPPVNEITEVRKMPLAVPLSIGSSELSQMPLAVSLSTGLSELSQMPLAVPLSTGSSESAEVSLAVPLSADSPQMPLTGLLNTSSSELTLVVPVTTSQASLTDPLIEVSERIDGETHTSPKTYSSSKISNTTESGDIENTRGTPRQKTIYIKSSNFNQSMDDPTKLVESLIKQYPQLGDAKKLYFKVNNSPNVKQLNVSNNVEETIIIEQLRKNRMEVDNVEGPWDCIECGSPDQPVPLTTYREFREHIHTVHRVAKNPCYCEYCGHKSVRRNLQLYHLLVKHQVEPPRSIQFPRCTHCDYIGLSVSAFRKHVANHSKIHQCLCKASFGLKIELERHIRLCKTVLQSKEYECSICKTRFDRIVNLRAHIRINHKHLMSKLTNWEDFAKTKQAYNPDVKNEPKNRRKIKT